MGIKPVISIIMPVRNEGERVAKAILSFAEGRSNLIPIEFIIVDDASADGCCNGLENLLTWKRNAAIITIVKLDEWSGIPVARNIGAAKARSAILFITDANVEAGPNWDIPVFRDLQPGRALCATIADMNSSWRGYGCLLDLPSMGIQWLRFSETPGSYVPVSPCTGTVIMTSLFRTLGGYDTAMPVYGAAEPEFSVRLWLYGGEIMNCPDLILRHRFRPAEERKPFLDRIGAIQIKNYIRFGLLYLDEMDINRMLDYWEKIAPYRAAECLRHAEAEGVWERRQHLCNSLQHDFTWYQKVINRQRA